MKNLLFLILFASHIQAQVSPQFEYQILARANVRDSLNLPEMSFLSNTSPSINISSDVVFKVMDLESSNKRALWFNREIIFQTEVGKYMSDPQINQSGLGVFEVFEEGSTDGIFQFNTRTKQVEKLNIENQSDIVNFTFSQMNDQGNIIFRSLDLKGKRSVKKISGKNLASIVSEGDVVFDEDVSYVFRPVQNNHNDVALKLRFGREGQVGEEESDAIAVKNAKGEWLKIASDRDMDRESRFKSFYNSVSINDKGQVAFVATTTDGGKGVFLHNPEQLVRAELESSSIQSIAQVGQFGITDIEYFSIRLNNQGHIVFRAIDMNGKRSIFLYDGNNVQRVIGEGDEVVADVYGVKILDNPMFPGLAGELGFNDQDEIVFQCILVALKSPKELGSAVYKVVPKKVNN